MWTGTELTEPSAFRSLARECKNGRLRAAFVAPHVSEESGVFKALERLRALKGPLLVECGRSFLSWPGIAKMGSGPGVNVYKFPCSHRRQHGATVNFCPRSICTVLNFWCSCDSQICDTPASHVADIS